MASTDMAPQLATEADFEIDDNAKASDANKVKDQVDDNAKASDAINKNQVDDSAKAHDATDKDAVDDTKATDANNEDQVDNKGIDKVATTVKDKAGDAKTSEDQEDQSWGSWQWTWNKKKEDQPLSHNAKKKLNKEMRDMVRPVHVGSLAYVFPDKAKKCCLTWRNAVEHHLGCTGKRPAWSAFFLECKICHRFSQSEREFENHYAARHSDASVYDQCLRRLKQWNTRDVPASEVDYNVELIYTVGQAINYQNKKIEGDMLAASGLPSVGDNQQEEMQKPVPVGSGSRNKPKEPSRPGMAPETPTPILAKLTEKGRATMGTIKKDAGKDNQKSKKDAGNEKLKRDGGKDAEKKRKEKAPVVNVDEDDEADEEDEYEYYSSSSEPPAKKPKKDPSSSSKKQEEMDVHGWKKRAVEFEKMLRRVTRENKSLRRQLSSVRAKKTKKSRSWKKAVRSLLEAGSDSSTSEPEGKK